MARPGLTEIGGTWVVDGSVKPWVPSGPRIPMPPPLQPRAKFPKAQPADLRKSLAASGTPSGAPSFVIATQEQIVEQGRTLALVTVSFVPPTPTSDVIGTNIWITGYKGNANWELISTTSQSPAQFVLEQTGDTVGVFCQSFGASGASTAPFTKQAYVTLSGPGAPPAPSLSQDLTVTPTGYQFTITQESGLLTNVVAGYNVYRNSVNDAATSTKIAHLKQDPTNTGGLVFSDVQPNGVTMYYWVTSVNTWGNESTFVAAQTGAVLAVTPITSTGAINSGSSLSASGTEMSAIDLSAVTGTQRNLVPDATLQLGSAWWGASGDTPASPTKVIQYGTGTNAFQIFTPASAWGTSGYIAQAVTIPVLAAQTYIASAWIDAAYPGACLQVNYPGGDQIIAQAAGSKGRVQSAPFAPSSNGTLTLYLIQREDHGAPANGSSANFAAPQLEVGSVMTGFRSNVLDDVTGGLVSGISVQEPGGSLSSVVLGDAHQRAATAIDSGFIVVPSGIDFSRLYTNKFGTYLPRASGDATTLDRAFAKLSAGDADTLDYVPDGSTYARYVASDATSNRLDFSKALLNKNGANLPRSATDGTTLDRAFAKGAAGDADTLVSIPDDASYAKTRSAFLGSGVPLVSAGKNLLQNPGFEFNNTGNPSQQDPPPTWPCDGWKTYQNDGPCGIGWDNTANDLQRSGVGCAIFRQRVTGVALAANTTYHNWLASAYQPAREGETWVAKGYRRLDNNATPPADVTINADFAISVFNAGGTEILGTHATTLTTANGGYQYVQLTVTAPPATAFVSLFLGSTWTVGATAQTTPTATTWGDVRFDDCALNCQIDYANEVLDGQTDANGAQWNRLAQVASDNTGVTLGYSGAVGLVVGNGFIAPSTGGYLPRRTVWSGPTGTEANGTVISFSALADQSGNPLPAFDTAPLVSLAPYNMGTAPALLYASGVTASGFTLNSYSAATASEGSAVNLPNGTAESVPATAGTTITGVVFTANVTAKTITPEQNFSQVVTVYVGGLAVGTITINGKTGGGTYYSSATDAVSGNPTSVTAKASWTLSSDVSSVSVNATPQQISGETAMSANVTCAITEQYNS